mmetsp:Transcript_7480/g.21280  ORF Transcript_7480/g.21280 Transcript_7480/m.21280 type:complete len:320 (-) Transcript_7480:858-1817(-)
MRQRAGERPAHAVLRPPGGDDQAPLRFQREGLRGGDVRLQRVVHGRAFLRVPRPHVSGLGRRHPWRSVHARHHERRVVRGAGRLAAAAGVGRHGGGSRRPGAVRPGGGHGRAGGRVPFLRLPRGDRHRGHPAGGLPFPDHPGGGGVQLGVPSHPQRGRLRVGLGARRDHHLPPWRPPQTAQPAHRFRHHVPRGHRLQRGDAAEEGAARPARHHPQRVPRVQTRLCSGGRGAPQRDHPAHTAPGAAVQRSVLRPARQTPAPGAADSGGPGGVRGPHRARDAHLPPATRDLEAAHVEQRARGGRRAHPLGHLGGHQRASGV